MTVAWVGNLGAPYGLQMGGHWEVYMKNVTLELCKAVGWFVSEHICGGGVCTLDGWVLLTDR